MPPVVGFVIGGEGVVGWDGEGQVVAWQRAGATPALHAALLVHDAPGEAGWQTSTHRRIRGDAGGQCVQLQDGDIACPAESAFRRLPSNIQRISNGCGFDATGNAWDLAEFRVLAPVPAALRPAGPAACQPKAIASASVPLPTGATIVSAADVSCALHDGTIACWGAMNEWLGDGTTSDLPAATALPHLGGARAFSKEGNVSCTLTGDASIRCFGRHGNQVVGSTPFEAPEPVARMVGGFPLCIEGQRTGRWYCRDPFSTFFKGSGANGFQVVVDPRTLRPATGLRTLAVDSGRGILAETQDGHYLFFSFLSTRQPLRFSVAPKRPVTDVLASEIPPAPPPPDVPPLLVLGHGCGLAEDGVPWCWGARETVGLELGPTTRSVPAPIAP